MGPSLNELAQTRQQCSTVTLWRISSIVTVDSLTHRLCDQIEQRLAACGEEGVEVIAAQRRSINVVRSEDRRHFRIVDAYLDMALDLLQIFRRCFAANHTSYDWLWPRSSFY